ncbi:hypothetical protein BaRGS_00011038 [Batillaria attramentaria]|uniref:Myb/SANT-like DNA-binding domain-containing protein n=1 Tax=Batillaria attramentaria TaxID=370345 RepID=A0ABD0LEK7_9CAEN
MAATTIVGVSFVDNSYFNVRISEREWARLESDVHGNWAIQGLVGELVSRAGLSLPSADIKSLTKGGIPDEGRVILNKLARPPPLDTAAAQCAHNNDCEGSQESQTSSSSMSWSHRAVLLLLEKYREYKWMLLDPRMKKMECFKKISTEMRAMGHQFSPDQCWKKFDNMKSRHKIIRDRNGKTGRGRSSWVYFDLMEDLMSGDPSVQPPVRISSLGGTSTSVDLEDSPVEIAPCPTSASTPTCGSSLADSETPQRIPETPRGIRKRRRRAEAPAWFKEYEQQQGRLMNRLADAMVERNDILKKMVEKM